MGDSDDDFDSRKSRDKFRRERSDYDSRARVPSKRDVYEERNGRGGSSAGGDMQSSKRYGSFREPSSPGQAEPPFKRTRREFGEEGGDIRGTSNMNKRSDNREDDYPTQPAMKSFKAFLNQLDDNVSDDDAMKKYKEYKEDFAKTQLQAFFNTHKTQEWFREKYHPDFCEKRHVIVQENIQKRLRVFMDLFDSKWVDQTRVHVDNTTELIKFIDAVVIKLEGGDDNDLRILDMKDPEPVHSHGPSSHAMESKRLSDRKSKDEMKKPKSRSYNNSDSSDDDDSSSSSSSSSSDSDSDADVADRRKRRKSKSKSVTGETAPVAKKSSVNGESSEEEGESRPSKEEKEVGEVPDDVDEDAPTPTTAENPVDLKETTSSTAAVVAKTSSVDVPEANGQTVKDLSNLPPPRALHKTYSIFLRSVHPDITRAEVEELCKSYNGFIRLALQDPFPERKFYRRGWVTFDRSVNIKEICWNLSNIRLKECDLGAIVNRELVQRVRPVMVLANHKPVMRQDIKFAARMVQKFDSRYNLWRNLPKDEEAAEGKKSKAPVMDYSISSDNPLMKNITDYLVDEGSYEEEALLGFSGSMCESGNPQEIEIDVDEELCKVLDRLILYLRVVHSVDYYSATEYPSEDEMPHLCGMIHARGAHIQPDKPIGQREVDDYMKAFDVKVAHLIEHVDRLSDKDAKKLGLKDKEAAAEKFIEDNTQELGKEKWLCPLSGKKFKGPDFVRKHIINKHGERLDEVKKESEYYNNYIRDPKRPQLPEHPSVASGSDRQVSGPSSHRDPYDRTGGSSRGPGGDYGGRSYMTSNSGGGGGMYTPYGRDYPPYDYGGRSGGTYYMPRDSYRSPPPPQGYGMREGYYGNRTPYDRSDRSGGSSMGNNYYRKSSYQSSYSNQKSYGGGRFSRGGFNRKMMTYTDLDAPNDD